MDQASLQGADQNQACLSYPAFQLASFLVADGRTRLMARFATL
jgi:hypothetical protein